MRDGEKFFSEGRDNAAFELKQKQMKLAGDYRTALRRSVLAQLSSLGRDSRLFFGPRQPRAYAARGFASYDIAGLGIREAGEPYFDELGERAGKDSISDAEAWDSPPFERFEAREEDEKKKVSEDRGF